MDKEVLIYNINIACKKAGIAPTKAFSEAGVGKDFFVNLRRSGGTSVSKVADLATYLGVSVSDLVGDAKAPAELVPLADAWANLNEEGRERLIAYAEDLVAGGRYIKNNSAALDQKGGAVG